MEEESKFRCQIDNLDTYQILLGPGALRKPWLADKHPLVVCSLEQAKQQHPQCADIFLSAFPDQTTQDVLCIYLPDQYHLDKPLQLIHFANIQDGSRLETKFCIYLGKNASLTLLQCNDTGADAKADINAYCAIHIEEQANLQVFNMQNIGDMCQLKTHLYLKQARESQFASFSISLNGGFLENTQEVCMQGDDAKTYLYGLYLTDKTQEVRNLVKIEHAALNGESVQLFKGILDDSAQGYFKGHIKVAPQAQKTSAFQNNKNLLLSSKAKFNTLPYLEIYADDVKCSHGATVGQIDENALFYLRARGIASDQAKRLLMYAFLDEIISKVEILPLRNKLESIVKKRLKGELSACEQCVLHCEEGESLCYTDW